MTDQKPATPPEPPAAPDAIAQRLEVLFRHVLHTPQGRHLWQLVLQYRRETKP